MELKNLGQSKLFKGILIGLSFAVFTLLVFQAGVAIGYRKASYSYRFGDNYYRAFSGGRPPFPGGFPGGDLPGGHGAVGRIVKVSLPTFVVATPDNIEKVVIIGKDTDIRRFRSSASSTELKVDDQVVVLGQPNNEGQIAAKLIRLLPLPPASKNLLK